MFDIGWGKILIVGVVALIVIGPHELPGLLKTLGQTVSKLKRMASDFQYQFNQALHESGANDIHSSFSDATNFDPVSIARESLKNAIEEVRPTTEAQGPTPPENFYVEQAIAKIPPIETLPETTEDLVKPARKPRKKKVVTDE